MWMFTNEPDVAFLQAVGRQKMLWKELCSMRFDTANEDTIGVKFDDTTQYYFAVCCPVPNSLGYFEEMSGEEMQSQILIPHFQSEGVFTSCNGELVQINGENLVLRMSNSEERKVCIHEVKQVPLTSFLKPSSSFPAGMADDVTITVYRVSKPFHSVTNYYCSEYPDEIEYRLVEKYVELLRTVPEAQPLFNDMDAYIEEVNLVGSHSKNGLSRIHPSFSASCYTIWDENTSKMLADDAIMSVFLGGEDASVASTEIITVGDGERTKMGQVLESYILHNVAVNVGKWVKRNGKHQDAKLHALSLAMRFLTQSDLDVPPAFQADQVKAIAELPKIKKALAPADKLLVLKRTVGYIREAIDANVRRKYPDNAELEMSTDDLIMAVVWVIVRACIEEDLCDFASEIRYISQFHFVSSPTSHLEFTLCHFQVALGWINGRLEIGQSSGGGSGRDGAASPLGGHSHADFLFAAETERSSSPRTVDSTAASSSSSSEFVYVSSEDEDKAKAETEADADTEAARDTEKEERGSTLELPPSTWKLATRSISSRLVVEKESRDRGSSNSNGLDLDLDLDFTLAVLRCSGHCLQPALMRLMKFPVGREGGLVSVDSAPHYHAVATTKGDVYSWGTPDSGRLGRDCCAEMDGSCLQPLEKPKVVEAMAAYKQIEEVGPVIGVSCGARHMLCATKKGRVFGWGDNRFLQVGVTATDAAAAAKALEGKKREMGEGGRRVLNLQHHSNSGEATRVLQLNAIACCGPVQLHFLVGIHIVMVACGSAHSLCLGQEGQVFSWGCTGNGRLGHALSHEDDVCSGIARVECEDWKGCPVTAICAGNAHSVAVTSLGFVYTWGSGLHGRLGHGCHVDRPRPTIVSCLSEPGAKVVSVAAGAAHTMFLEEGGLLMGCGLDSSGQVRASTPAVIDAAPLYARELSPNPVDVEGVIEKAEIKEEESTVRAVLCPLPVKGLAAVKRVQCGPFYTVAQTLAAGEVVAWGQDCLGRPVD